MRSRLSPLWRHPVRWTLLTMLLAMACSKDPNNDSATDAGPSCKGNGPKNVTIGQGSGSAFYPLESGAAVGLDIAPQGGFGVSVRAETTGLKADDLVDVNLITELAGEQTGEFLNEGVQLYCQESGNGLLWGVVVGFDRFQFPNIDDLINFDRELGTRVGGITDIDSDYAEGRVEVIVEVSG